MTPLWTQTKFLSLPPEQQHKKASELLRQIQRGERYLEPIYNNLCIWMNLALLPKFSLEPLSNRFHLHLQNADVSWQEHNLLLVNKSDQPSDIACLPIGIYLDNLRSAFNVGSILRTVEAFRLGTVYFSRSTPFINHPKVQKTSMGTFDKIRCIQVDSLEGLPRPFIALETVTSAPTISDFTFPPSFTLLLGNEEYGLSETTLASVDQFVQIPLLGYKNSLNVASAFAIAASKISQFHFI
ncbi:MAG: TrmH family RNA methyltransferase [Alphaproteobacteria bacterium]|nr:TrmH family RNA methyltransferase [Alphaproteobacteria bacterium]